MPPCWMVLQVSMECRFLAHSVASIDGMSLPRGFGCKYRLNVASLLFLKNLVLWVSMECRLPTIFEIWGFFEPLFLFWNLGCGYQLKRCVSTIFLRFWKYWRGVAFLRFWGFGSIEWGSHPSDFWVLCEYRLNVASPRFFEKPFFLFKDTRVVNFGSKPSLVVKVRVD